MEQKTVNLAVVGLGMASKPHLAALSQLVDSDTNIAVKGIFTRNEQRRFEVSQQWGFDTYDRIEQIAQDSNVDAVIMVTPPNARLKMVQLFASAGQHILMEKPVEWNFKNALTLVETCESKNVLLGMVLQHRFRKGAEAITELVNSGKLGKIALARVLLPWWREQSYYDAPGRGTYDVDGGGVLITQAIHVLDLMLSLTGPAKSVQAMTGTTPFHTMEAEDFATIGIIFESGAMGSVVATTASYPGGAEVLQIDAEHASVKLEAGELTINWRNGKVETIGEITGTGGGADPMDFPCDWHRDCIADFVDSIRHGHSPRITGRDALEVHKLLEAITVSAKQGKAISL